jgi:pyridoxal biosynthesis lyase PdxS
MRRQNLVAVDDAGLAEHATAVAALQLTTVPRIGRAARSTCRMYFGVPSALQPEHLIEILIAMSYPRLEWEILQPSVPLSWN